MARNSSGSIGTTSSVPPAGMTIFSGNTYSTPTNDHSPTLTGCGDVLYNSTNSSPAKPGWYKISSMTIGPIFAEALAVPIVGWINAVKSLGVTDSFAGMVTDQLLSQPVRSASTLDTVNVQMPLGFSPSNIANDSCGRNTPSNGAAASAMFKTASSSNTVPRKLSPRPPT